MKKLSYEEVKKCFSDKGCELLETEYVNNRTIMSYKCNCENISKINYNNFKRGQRCGCNRGLRKSQKFPYEEVKNYFLEQGCELLETKYVNSQTIMSYRCNCGNISKIRFSNFKTGVRCGCQRNLPKNTLLFEDVKKYFEKQGCKLLENKYKNNRTKMKYLCSCGNRAEINYDNFKRGQRCKNCGIKKQSGENSSLWNLNRKNVELNKKIGESASTMLKRCLNFAKQIKTTKTEITLGYSRKDLKEHIVNHPNWEAVKNITWHIDHIMPIKAFVDHNIFDFKIINALDNLQPLSKSNNLSKGDKYNLNEFKLYLLKKGIII